MRTVTVKFADGSSHVYQNVPDETTPADVQGRAGRDFPNLKLVNIDGGGGASAIPDVAGPDGRGVALPRVVEPAANSTALQKVVGTGEAALTTATGAIGGSLGLIGGTLKGLAEQILSGNFGTAEAANLVEQSAAQGAQALTYAPRTQAGQAIVTENVAPVMQALLPLAGLTPQMGALSEAAVPVRSAVRTGAAAVADRAAQALDRPAEMAAAKAPMQAPELAAAAKKAADGGIGSQAAAKVLAEQAAPDPVKVASAQRLGITEYLQPDHVTTNEAFRQINAAIKSNPQSKVALVERENLTAVAKRASDLIDEIGGATDLSTLASDVKTRLQADAGRMNGQADMLWGKLRREIPDSTKVEAPATVAALQEIVQSLGGESQARLALPAEARKFLTPLFDGEPVTHGYLDMARKQVGQATQRATGPFANMEQGQLKRFYAALSQDQEAASKMAGQKAYYTFQAAKYATRLQKGFEDDLASLFGRNLDRSFVASGEASLPRAVSVLAKGDAAPLGRLLSSVPKDMRQRVVASGLSTVFNKAAKDGVMDFTGYANWYEGLRNNRKAYGAVMSNLPLSARKQLAALYNVSRGVSDSINRRTKTGALNTIKAEMMGTDSLMESLFGLAKRGAVAVPAEAAATSVGLPGAGLSAAIASALTKGKAKPLAAIDELLASPEFAQMAKTPPGPQQAAAIRRFAYSRAFSKAIRALGSPKEVMADRERWILQAMQQQPQQTQREN